MIIVTPKKMTVSAFTAKILFKCKAKEFVKLVDGKMMLKMYDNTIKFLKLEDAKRIALA